MVSIEKFSSPQPRRIALVDCNNFYVSCERVFNPRWQKLPLGVLSNNDGCIVARSNELKEAGIPMGAPYFKWRQRLEDIGAVIVSSNYALYGDMSTRVMNILGEFIPEVEIYSIDEAWLELTGFNSAHLDAYGRKIVAKTKQCTGIPVSMGIAPTKVLAKIANRICKQRNIPGQVFNLGSADALKEVLTTVDIRDVWGIGRRWAQRLRAQHLYTAWDLRCADPDAIAQQYSVVLERIVRELQGIPCLTVEDIQAKKQIMASRSFGHRVTDKASLLEAVATHTHRATTKLRQQRSTCSTIQVSIRSSQFDAKAPFYSNSATIRLPMATADTRKLIAAAVRAIDQIYQPGIPYAKAGVMLLDISPAGMLQQNLFAQGDNEKSVRLMATVDRLNQTLGKGTVFFAREGLQPTWGMKQQAVTPAYTTRWEDVPIVR